MVGYWWIKKHANSNGFVTRWCLWKLTRSTCYRWFLEVATVDSEKGYPKLICFQKIARIKKDGWFLWGGMNHFQCYWRLFSGVLRVEFWHVVFLWRWWSCSLWIFSFKALCLCSVLRGRQGDLLHGAGGGDVLKQEKSSKELLTGSEVLLNSVTLFTWMRLRLRCC